MARAKLLVAVVLTVLAGGICPQQARAATAVSPLLWGENLELDGGADWFLDSADLRTALKTAHTRIVRMPVRGPDPDTAGWANEAQFKAAATYVEQLGMVPLVILRNPEAPQSRDTDTLVVDFVRGLFGDQPVYYEFGNETDLDDGTGNYVTASSYVTHWNQFVPVLKSRAGAQARFLGPVSYQYDDGYLRTFLAGAQPRPDAISWHMYTCHNGEPEDACLNAGGIDDWPAKIAAARTAMQSVLGTTLPIWVTEWNFNSGRDVTSDPNLRDQTFLRNWTLKALRTLANSGVTASMHFNVANAVPLAEADGSLTAEGKAFKDAYEQLGSDPAPSGVKYSFEDGGVDGWSKTGNVSACAASTDAGGQDGTHALRVTFSSTSAGDLPYVHVNPASGPAAGQVLTAYVQVPSSSTATVTAKLYVQDAGNVWHSSGGTVVGARGTWVPLSFTPSGYSGSARQVGVQFGESPGNTSTTVYLDAVSWS